MSNEKLLNAKRVKNDEFYTLLKDIEKELQYYKDHFKDKIVYCPCDDPKFSNFWKYFSDNFETLGLKKLMATYINLDFFGKSECWIKTKDNLEIRKLSGNGDFRNSECLEILKESDIVVTNPPFSLFQEFLNIVISSGKDYLILGNQNGIIHKSIISEICQNKLFWGPSKLNKMEFLVPQSAKRWSRIDEFGNKYVSFSGIRWFTSILTIENPFLELTKTLDSQHYDFFDNSEILNINKTKDIPKDWFGLMGVPITFFDKYNPEQFRILGIVRYPKIKSKNIFTRLLIQRV